MGRLMETLLVLRLISLTTCSLSTRAAALHVHDLQRGLEQAMRVRLLADATAPGGAVVVPILSNVVNFTIGAPPQPASAFIVGGLLVWTQCSQCSSCFKQEQPLFDPTKSSTYRPEPCGTALCEFFPTSNRNCSSNVCAYEASTQLFEHTFGKIGTDTVAIGTATASLAFGCVVASDIKHMDGGPSRFVGLARTPLSLVAQMNVTVFSHCLVPYDSGKNSRLFLGASAILAGGKGTTRTMPFVKSSPDDIKSLYYLIHLEGIKAGDEAVAMPQGGSTVLLQMFAPISFLVDSVYQVLKKAVTAAVGEPTATPAQFQLYFDICFLKARVSSAPSLVFTFQGAAALTVPPSNYLLDIGDDTVCLAIVSSARLNLSAELDGGVSILGGLQQQNIHFLYDLEKETLSFEPADCSTLT